MFRHTAATLMLEAGADIRYVQQMLGHAQLDTTGISSHVSIQALLEVYRATHPAARIDVTPEHRKAREDALDRAKAADLFTALAEEDDDAVVNEAAAT